MPFGQLPGPTHYAIAGRVFALVEPKPVSPGELGGLMALAFRDKTKGLEGLIKPLRPFKIIIFADKVCGVAGHPLRAAPSLCRVFATLSRC